MDWQSDIDSLRADIADLCKIGVGEGSILEPLIFIFIFLVLGRGLSLSF